MEYAVTVRLKKGQNVFEQGSNTQGFFCIRSGAVKLALNAGNGDSMTVDLYSDSGMLGHHCMVSPTNFYTATCLTDAEVCFIPKSAVAKIKPPASLDSKIRNQIGGDYIRLNEIISSLRTKSTLQRTAEVLVRLQATFGSDNDGAVNLYVTKGELANIIGSSVESVFRTLGRLRQKKYINFEKSKIWIKDESKLRAIARLNS